MGKPTQKYATSGLYDQVVGEHGVFEFSYEFMVFLAVVGYREGRIKRSNYQTGPEGDNSEISLQNLYSKEKYRVLMASLAFDETGDPESLVDSKEQLRILVQYAAGGLEVAEEEFGNIAGDPTDAILNYIQTFEESTEYQGTLGEIVDAFDDQMLGLEETEQ